MTGSTTEQEPKGILTFEEVEVSALVLNDIVKDHGLLVQITPKDEESTDLGFGSTRDQGKPHVESTVPMGNTDKVMRVARLG